MDDRWAIEKYFATNLEKLKNNFKLKKCVKKIAMLKRNEEKGEYK